MEEEPSEAFDQEATSGDRPQGEVRQDEEDAKEACEALRDCWSTEAEGRTATSERSIVSAMALASARLVCRTMMEQVPNETLFVARCCGRIYIGRERAAKCRTCEEPAKNVEIGPGGDLDNLQL